MTKGIKMVKNTIIILLAIGYFVLVGCGTSGPEEADNMEDMTPGPEKADSMKDIVGTWHRVQPGEGLEFYCQFSDDETYVCDRVLERINNNSARIKGRYWFEGAQYFSREAGCPPVGVYEINIQSSGNFKYALIEDECAMRAANVVGRDEEEGLIEWESVP